MSYLDTPFDKADLIEKLLMVTDPAALRVELRWIVTGFLTGSFYKDLNEGDKCNYLFTCHLLQDFLLELEKLKKLND